MNDNGRPTLNKRLELARIEVGAATLREFHDRLREAGVEGFPTYASARTYHNRPWRTPSARYLAAIVVRYPQIDGGWLLRG